jgi:type VI secretion system protein VasD
VKRRRLILSVASLAAPAGMSGCGGKEPPPPPPPTTLSIQFNAASDVNPDGTGAPEPLRVRVLQLAATGTLSQADFFMFDADPAKVLGPDLLATEDIVLRPDQKTTITPEAKPGIKFIGIVGAYYAIDKARWRAWSPIKPNTANKLVIDCKAAEIGITGGGG